MAPSPLRLDPQACLPVDAARATLLGRAWGVDPIPGPSVVVIEGGAVFDITERASTVAAVLNARDPCALLRGAPRARRLGSVAELLSNSAVDTRDPARPYFLAPCDLQPVKACGVTFVGSLIERVIEERVRGDPQRVNVVRAEIEAVIGAELRGIVPGSAAAAALKAELIRRDLWSPYLEVGIGPDAEVFTKAVPLSAIGTGAAIGILRSSEWNNPEPEVVLAVNARGAIVGVTLGNDVNLRDIEGRSALLLGKAKDNNGSCAIGPFIRVFDGAFTVEDARRLSVRLEVRGADGFRHVGGSNTAAISRPFEDLVAQTIGPHHQYPDGLMLFTGTTYTPTQARDAATPGFTHRPDDVVTIAAAPIGALVNCVRYSDEIEPWSFGLADLIANLGARGLWRAAP
jgi:fumarylacetoacetate (FAA) hydrolase family protein